MSEKPLKGFAHHPTDEQLRAYRKLSPDEKLAWLEAARQMTADFLPAEKRALYEKMRRGDI